MLVDVLVEVDVLLLVEEVVDVDVEVEVTGGTVVVVDDVLVLLVVVVGVVVVVVVVVVGLQSLHVCNVQDIVGIQGYAFIPITGIYPLNSSSPTQALYTS